ncbi:T9SS type A sorting domain-containing protein [bacterium SCSIO 12741]|nr:T9SS type A sorting domain-containing protein [bacterium SCSIO 12741]
MKTATKFLAILSFLMSPALLLAQTQTWAISFGNSPLYNIPHDISINPNGELLITGDLSDTTTIHGNHLAVGGFAVGLDDSGKTTRALNESVHANQGLQDKHGNYYVYGSRGSQLQALTKFSPADTALWTQSILYTFGQALNFDSKGYLIAGHGYRDSIVVQKVDPASGSVIWSVKKNYPGSIGGLMVASATVDNQDNIYVCYGQPNYARITRILKLSPSGQELDSLEIGKKVSHGRLSFSGDHLYFAGNFFDTLNYSNTTVINPHNVLDAFVYKIDTKLDVKGHVHLQSKHAVEVKDIATDGAGGVFVVGHTRDSLYYNQNLIVSGRPAFERSFLIKMDEDLKMDWLYEPTSDRATGETLCASTSHVYMAGTARVTSNIHGTPVNEGQIFVAKIENTPYTQSIENLTAVDPIKVYPNPTQGNMQIVSSDEAIQSISIYAFNGQLMDKVAPNHSNNKLQVDISHLPAGCYILQIQNDKHLQTSRIIKQ